MTRSLQKDFFYETALDSLIYSIYCDGEGIFHGKAYKSPSSSTLRINVAQRIRDWLFSDMPDFREWDGQVAEHPEALRTFELRASDGTLLDTYTVLLDYSTPFTGTDMILSTPVNGHADARQKIFWSSFGTAARNIPVEVAADLHIDFYPAPPFYIDGTGGTLTVSYTANTDFTVSSTGDWFTVTDNGDGTLTITAQENEGEGRSGSICFSYFGGDFQTHTVCYRVVQGSYVNLCVESAVTYEVNIPDRSDDGPYYPGPWAWCEQLRYVNAPNLVSTTGGTFLACPNLEVALVPKLETAVGRGDTTYFYYPSGMFSECSSLTSIELPSIKYLGNATFAECPNLTSVTLGSGLTYVGTGVLYLGNSSTKTVTINYLGTRRQLDSATYANWRKSYRSRDIRILCTDGYALHTWNGDTFVRLTPPGYESITSDTIIHDTISASTNFGEYVEDVTVEGNNIRIEFRGTSTRQLPLNSLRIVGTGTAPTLYLKINGVSGNATVGMAVEIDMPSDGTVSIPASGLSQANITSFTVHPLQEIKLEGGSFASNSRLTYITFLGTKAQWNACVHYYQNWKRLSKITSIHCTDGNISV